MASADARARWLRNANHCFIDEDYKGVSRTHSSPSSSSKSEYEGSPSNLLPDTKWWLHRQTTSGDHCVCSPGHEDILETEVGVSRAESVNRTATQIYGARTYAKSTAGSLWDPSWEALSACMENEGLRIEELEAVISDTFQKNEDTCEFRLADEKPNKLFSELESHWIGVEKTEPWWRTADIDELASFVSHKSLEHFENCDLPGPQRKHSQSFDHDKGLASLGQKAEKEISNLTDSMLKTPSSVSMGKEQSMLGAIECSPHVSDMSSRICKQLDMPFVDVAAYQCGVDAAANNGIKIFYRTYGGGPVKVLMIIGLAGTHDSWGPQIKGIAGTATSNDEQWPDNDRSSPEDGPNGVEVCAFDNRGMGRSSIPTKKSEYTTRIMAKDAIAVMDHLGWKKAHVFGHSMGGMIACKLAAIVPDRILSLALLNVTGGGYECFPKEYLEECVGLKTRRAILYQEYVKGISASGMQSNFGFDGQINACWTHKMSRTELEFILSTGFLVSVIHGRHDIIAQIGHAKRLAEKLHPYARMVELHGGHLVSHERTQEVNEALLELIKASENKISPHEWTNLPAKSSGKYQKVKATSRVSSISDLPTFEIGVRSRDLARSETTVVVS